MRARVLRVTAAALLLTAMNGADSAHAALPPGNTVEQWNVIAENTVVGSGAFQNEGLIYMAYVSTAVYNALVAIQGGYAPLNSSLTAPHGASEDCAVVEAAYRTLRFYFSSFPMLVSSLDASHDEALTALAGCTGDGGAGAMVGLAAAEEVIYSRTIGPEPDGVMTPIGVTSSIERKPAGPGVWRLTPPAFLPPQTPWVAQVRPFVLQSADQFLPDAPPSLASADWVDSFKQIKAYGAAAGSARTDAQTKTAIFWTANVIRQYGGAFRNVVDTRGLGLLDAARLAAMVFVVGADAQIAVMYAKYHYLFWRPVTAIDPTAVTADTFGPVPGFDDGNTATAEQTGWRPLLTTPNHPEYPAAHGSFTSAMAEVFTAFLGTRGFHLVVRGADPAGAPGNLLAERTFDSPSTLRAEIIDARTWGGLHYHFSGVAGVVLGRNVAKYDLNHAFQPLR